MSCSPIRCDPEDVLGVIGLGRSSGPGGGIPRFIPEPLPCICKLLVEISLGRPSDGGAVGAALVEVDPVRVREWRVVTGGTAIGTCCSAAAAELTEGWGSSREGVLVED